MMHSGGTLLPPAYGAFPYHAVQAPQVLPATVTAAAALQPSLRTSTSYASYPSFIYWPYPSPPVSPTTYYAHSTGPTMVIMRGLPFSATIKDVIKFFNGWEVSGINYLSSLSITISILYNNFILQFHTTTSYYNFILQFQFHATISISYYNFNFITIPIS